jgi:hypothetical protein
VDNQLKNTSSVANLLTGRDRQTPKGWAATTAAADHTATEAASHRGEHGA